MCVGPISITRSLQTIEIYREIFVQSHETIPGAIANRLGPSLYFNTR